MVYFKKWKNNNNKCTQFNKNSVYTFILLAESFDLKRYYSISKDCRHIQMICDIRPFLWFLSPIEM